jgi:hypothetical protein
MEALMRKHGFFAMTGVMLALATVFWAKSSISANGADVVQSNRPYVSAAWFLPISHYGLYVNTDWFVAIGDLEPAP